MPQKMTILILIVMSVLFVDNLCGFSYYFVQSYKLDYITSLENARLKYAQDEVVSQELDRMMVSAINRWTVASAVSDIFQKTFSTTSEAREQKLVKEIAKKKDNRPESAAVEKNQPQGILSQWFPVAERSPFWHTVCSSLILIFVLLVCVIYLMSMPFTQDKDKKNTLLGICVIIPLLIGAIFFTQWLLSYIPDIYGRPRINNTIYVIINIFVSVYIIKKIAK